MKLPSFSNRLPLPRARRLPAGQQGIALVITLILLSVITFMAISFLVLSRNDKGSVNTTTEQTTARLAAEAALAQAESEIVVPLMVAGNQFTYDYLVSTNYINPLGFQTVGGPAVYSNPTNVNYTYPNGNPLTGNDALQNLSNLMYNARAPVFYTNRLAANSYDFRFYLDLNRDGFFEPSGVLIVTNFLGQPLVDAQGNYVTSRFVGDPQWIGGLEFPDRPHGPNNKFIYRYAYVVVPVNKTLDVNYIHNYAKLPSGLGGLMDRGLGDGFYRNQGVGTFEINLGAFFNDLNTNVWTFAGNPYRYYWNTNDFRTANTGPAFDDALAILTNRYGAYATKQASVTAMFGTRGNVAFRSDYVDGYSAGPPMIGPYWQPFAADGDFTRLTDPWSGANNTNHFFSPQDFFDASKSSLNFVTRLSRATTNSLSSYDRYTYYRMLSQLGTESVPDGQRLNLNYRNVDNAGKVMPNVSTNFVPWEPIVFFTNAADRLLANAGYNFTTAKIQIYPTNFYTPNVHRLLQLAANIYDATTNRTFGVSTATNGYPSVFRPLFLRTNINNVEHLFVNGYEEVNDANIIINPPPIHDLTLNGPTNVLRTDMVYGVPLVLGSHKGFPNFNEFEMATCVQVTRKLEFIRRDLAGPNRNPDETNQMFVVGISNVIGLEAWNAYMQSYPRPGNLRLFLTTTNSAYIRDQSGNGLLLTGWNPQNPANDFQCLTNMQRAAWPGYRAANDNSFFVPVSTNYLTLTNSTFVANAIPTPQYFIPETGTFQKGPLYLPQWWLTVRTRLTFALVDTSRGPGLERIVDYINLSANQEPLDLTYSLMLKDDGTTPAYGEKAPYLVPTDVDTAIAGMWATNGYRLAGTNFIGPTYGITNQIAASMDNFPTQVGKDPRFWAEASGASPDSTQREGAIAFFRTNFAKLSYSATTFRGPLYLTNRFFAPYTPTRSIVYYTSWQANDPLVHFTVGDLDNPELLKKLPRRFEIAKEGKQTGFSDTIANLGRLNVRYEPWMNGTAKASNPYRSASETATDLRVKDPGIVSADDWDFPTNRFPNIGWLGRVHRGTPWQTVYFKSAIGSNIPPLDLPTWTNWCANTVYSTNVGQIKASRGLTNWAIFPDAIFSSPTNDWAILDLFTTAFNENAGRSKMSVNQSGLAAWSATLAGLLTMTNTLTDADMLNLPPPRFEPFAIPPAGIYDPTDTNNLPPLVRMVNAINDWRTTNAVGSVFHKLGDILAVPELTLASPFLNRSADIARYGLNDTAYERIPQQVLGLLQCESTPRFVIYSYGQSLKPAPASIVSSGPYFGLCTNYQVTAESATRAVVRIEGAPDQPRAVIESYNVLPPD